MSAHTPGPWELDHGDDGDNFTIRADGEFVTRLTKSRYTDDRRDPEAYANAALIAAAPDLLAALRAMIGDGVTIEQFHNREVLARAAIARAEGRS
ncbi:MAG: hypothetical protein KAX77_01235 [Xanthomonadales bacterium]|nr:hypothetical protein [Xanthomonadales bacterium]